MATADFATVDDLAAMWPELADEDRAEVLLSYASAKIRAYWPDIDDRLAAESAPLNPLLPQFVACSMVKRAMSSSGDGVTQQVSTMGPISTSQSFANPSGKLYLSKDEIKLLSPSGPRARASSVSISTDTAGTANLPWWDVDLAAGDAATVGLPWWDQPPVLG